MKVLRLEENQRVDNMFSTKRCASSLTAVQVIYQFLYLNRLLHLLLQRMEEKLEQYEGEERTHCDMKSSYVVQTLSRHRAKKLCGV